MGLMNRQTLVKVPELVLLFWIAKVGTTCFGEAFSDFVFFNDASWITRDRAIAAGAVLILIAYGIQIATKKYIPLVYWFAVTAVAIFGDHVLGLPHQEPGLDAVAGHPGLARARRP